MENIILTDVDGCLLQWLPAFLNWMEEKGHLVLPNTEHLYSLTDRYDLEYDFIRNCIWEFSVSKIGNKLNPVYGAYDTVHELVDRGFRFICITSIGNSYDVYIKRKVNLLTVFGDVFDEIICLPMGSDKSLILQRWSNTGLIWIEDHLRHAKAGNKIGLDSILIDTLHNNCRIDDFVRVDRHNPWPEIKKIIYNKYKIEG